MANLYKEIEKKLETFKTANEWSDFISMLGSLEKTLKKLDMIINLEDEIPCNLFYKRMNQCLNSSLPAGVHNKVIKIYCILFEKIKAGEDFIFADAYRKSKKKIIEGNSTKINGKQDSSIKNEKIDGVISKIFSEEKTSKIIKNTNTGSSINLIDESTGKQKLYFSDCVNNIKSDDTDKISSENGEYGDKIFLGSLNSLLKRDNVNLLEIDSSKDNIDNEHFTSREKDGTNTNLGSNKINENMQNDQNQDQKIDVIEFDNLRKNNSEKISSNEVETCISKENIQIQERNEYIIFRKILLGFFTFFYYSKIQSKMLYLDFIETYLLNLKSIKIDKYTRNILLGLFSGIEEDEEINKRTNQIILKVFDMLVDKKTFWAHLLDVFVSCEFLRLAILSFWIKNKILLSNMKNEQKRILGLGFDVPISCKKECLLPLFDSFFIYKIYTTLKNDSFSAVKASNTNDHVTNSNSNISSSLIPKKTDLLENLHQKNQTKLDSNEKSDIYISKSDLKKMHKLDDDKDEVYRYLHDSELELNSYGSLFSSDFLQNWCNKTIFYFLSEDLILSFLLTGLKDKNPIIVRNMLEILNNDFQIHEFRVTNRIILIRTLFHMLTFRELSFNKRIYSFIEKSLDYNDFDSFNSLKFDCEIAYKPCILNYLIISFYLSLDLDIEKVFNGEASFKDLTKEGAVCFYKSDSRKISFCHNTNYKENIPHESIDFRGLDNLCSDKIDFDDSNFVIPDHHNKQSDNFSSNNSNYTKEFIIKNSDLYQCNDVTIRDELLKKCTSKKNCIYFHYNLLKNKILDSYLPTKDKTTRSYIYNEHLSKEKLEIGNCIVRLKEQLNEDEQIVFLYKIILVLIDKEDLCDYILIRLFIKSLYVIYRLRMRNSLVNCMKYFNILIGSLDSEFLWLLIIRSLNSLLTKVKASYKTGKSQEESYEARVINNIYKQDCNLKKIYTYGANHGQESSCDRNLYHEASTKESNEEDINNDIQNTQISGFVEHVKETKNINSRRCSLYCLNNSDQRRFESFMQAKKELLTFLDILIFFIENSELSDDDCCNFHLPNITILLLKEYLYLEDKEFADFYTYFISRISILRTKNKKCIEQENILEYYMKPNENKAKIFRSMFYHTIIKIGADFVSNSVSLEESSRVLLFLANKFTVEVFDEQFYYLYYKNALSIILTNILTKTDHQNKDVACDEINERNTNNDRTTNDCNKKNNNFEGTNSPDNITQIGNISDSNRSNIDDSRKNTTSFSDNDSNNIDNDSFIAKNTHNSFNHNNNDFKNLDKKKYRNSYDMKRSDSLYIENYQFTKNDLFFSRFIDISIALRRFNMINSIQKESKILFLILLDNDKSEYLYKFNIVLDRIFETFIVQLLSNSNEENYMKFRNYKGTRSKNNNLNKYGTSVDSRINNKERLELSEDAEIDKTIGANINPDLDKNINLPREEENETINSKFRIITEKCKVIRDKQDLDSNVIIDSVIENNIKKNFNPNIENTCNSKKNNNKFYLMSIIDNEKDDNICGDLKNSLFGDYSLNMQMNSERYIKILNFLLYIFNEKESCHFFNLLIIINHKTMNQELLYNNTENDKKRENFLRFILSIKKFDQVFYFLLGLLNINTPFYETEKIISGYEILNVFLEYSPSFVVFLNKKYKNNFNVDNIDSDNFRFGSLEYNNNSQAKDIISQDSNKESLKDFGILKTRFTENEIIYNRKEENILLEESKRTNNDPYKLENNQEAVKILSTNDNLGQIKDKKTEKSPANKEGKEIAKKNVMNCSTYGELLFITLINIFTSNNPDSLKSKALEIINKIYCFSIVNEKNIIKFDISMFLNDLQHSKSSKLIFLSVDTIKIISNIYFDKLHSYIININPLYISLFLEIVFKIDNISNRTVLLENLTDRIEDFEVIDSIAKYLFFIKDELENSTLRKFISIIIDKIIKVHEEYKTMNEIFYNNVNHGKKDCTYKQKSYNLLIDHMGHNRNIKNSNYIKHFQSGKNNEKGNLISRNLNFADSNNKDRNKTKIDCEYKDFCLEESEKKSYQRIDHCDNCLNTESNNQNIANTYRNDFYILKNDFYTVKNKYPTLLEIMSNNPNEYSDNTSYLGPFTTDNNENRFQCEFTNLNNKKNNDENQYFNDQFSTSNENSFFEMKCTQKSVTNDNKIPLSAENNFIKYNNHHISRNKFFSAKRQHLLTFSTDTNVKEHISRRQKMKRNILKAQKTADYLLSSFYEMFIENISTTNPKNQYLKIAQNKAQIYIGLFKTMETPNFVFMSIFEQLFNAKDLIFIIKNLQKPIDTILSFRSKSISLEKYLWIFSLLEKIKRNISLEEELMSVVIKTFEMAFIVIQKILKSDERTNKNNLSLNEESKVINLHRILEDDLLFREKLLTKEFDSHLKNNMFLKSDNFISNYDFCLRNCVDKVANFDSSKSVYDMDFYNFEKKNFGDDPQNIREKNDAIFSFFEILSEINKTKNDIDVDNHNRIRSKPDLILVNKIASDLKSKSKVNKIFDFNVKTRSEMTKHQDVNSEPELEIRSRDFEYFFKRAKNFVPYDFLNTEEHISMQLNNCQCINNFDDKKINNKENKNIQNKLDYNKSILNSDETIYKAHLVDTFNDNKYSCPLHNKYLDDTKLFDKNENSKNFDNYKKMIKSDDIIKKYTIDAEENQDVSFLYNSNNRKCRKCSNKEILSKLDQLQINQKTNFAENDALDDDSINKSIKDLKYELCTCKETQHKRNDFSIDTLNKYNSCMKINTSKFLRNNNEENKYLCFDCYENNVKNNEHTSMSEDENEFVDMDELTKMREFLKRSYSMNEKYVKKIIQKEHTVDLFLIFLLVHINSIFLELRNMKIQNLLKQYITILFIIIKNRAGILLYLALENISDISKIRSYTKTWKKDFLDYLLTPKFFEDEILNIKTKTKITENMLKDDTQSIQILFEKLETSFFVSKESEQIQKTMTIKRIAFLIYCGKINHFEKNLPRLLEIISENINSNNIQAKKATYGLVRQCVRRITSSKINILWPLIFSDINSYFDRIIQIDKIITDISYFIEIVKTLETIFEQNINDTVEIRWNFMDPYSYYSSLECDLLVALYKKYCQIIRDYKIDSTVKKENFWLKEYFCDKTDDFIPKKSDTSSDAVLNPNIQNNVESKRLNDLINTTKPNNTSKSNGFVSDNLVFNNLLEYDNSSRQNSTEIDNKEDAVISDDIPNLENKLKDRSNEANQTIISSSFNKILKFKDKIINFKRTNEKESKIKSLNTSKEVIKEDKYNLNQKFDKNKLYRSKSQGFVANMPEEINTDLFNSTPLSCNSINRANSLDMSPKKNLMTKEYSKNLKIPTDELFINNKNKDFIFKNNPNRKFKYSAKKPKELIVSNRLIEKRPSIESEEISIEHNYIKKPFAVLSSDNKKSLHQISQQSPGQPNCFNKISSYKTNNTEKNELLIALLYNSKKNKSIIENLTKNYVIKKDKYIDLSINYPKIFIWNYLNLRENKNSQSYFKKVLSAIKNTNEIEESNLENLIISSKFFSSLLTSKSTEKEIFGFLKYFNSYQQNKMLFSDINCGGNSLFELKDFTAEKESKK